MRTLIAKLLFLLTLACALGYGAHAAGMGIQQSLSITIFSASILGTLFFWDFRLSFAFIGTSVLLMTKTIDLEHVIEFASLEVILFLVGMMIIIALLKEQGFFAWIVQVILCIRKLTATRFLLIISLASALLSAATSEVVSIIFMVAAVLEICDYFEVNPLPFVIISVLATNIGSAATVLGNPIGILIASKSGLTFEDFIIKAFPLAMVCLGAAILVVWLWYRKAIASLDHNMKELGTNEMLIRLLSVPPNRQLRFSMVVFGVTLFAIAMHHRIEVWGGLAPNTALLAVPLIVSGAIMIWRHQKAREFVEHDVEWWTLLFFLLLFVQAGTLKYTGATVFIAEKIVKATGTDLNFLTTVILWVATVGSSILDNVVLVAAFIPVVQGFGALHFNLQPLWWALLFGGCLGGNITLVGSTANIVALGILEKDENIKVTFFTWFWVGLAVGVVTTAIVWAALLFLPWYR